MSTNGSSAARAVAVEPAREHALAAAGLALDQDRAARGLRPCARPRRARRIAAEVPGEGVDAPRGPGARGRPPGGASRAGVSSRRRSITSSAGQLDRLGQELVGAFLHRAHREVDRRVAGQHHDGQRSRRSRGSAAAARARCRRAACGRARPRPGGSSRTALLRRGAGVGLLDLEALALEEVADPEADPGLVVDDQDLGQAACRSRAHCRTGESGTWRAGRGTEGQLLLTGPR